MYYAWHTSSSLKYLQLEFIHSATIGSATDQHALIGEKIYVRCKTHFHGFLYLQLPGIHAATTCNTTDRCRKISDSVKYLQLTGIHGATDIALQSVVTCMSGVTLRYFK